jgi:hypothetical protein
MPTTLAPEVRTLHSTRRPRLAREGLLRPGAGADLSIASHVVGRSAIVRLVAEEESIRLYAWGSDQSVRLCCRVRVERTGCRYGGTRPWFRCPRCDSRRAVLFGFASDGRFGCWGCMDLVYASQDERKMSRLWRKQAILERKLVDGYRKPNGMHWRTFVEICKKLDSAFAKEERLFCDGARALMRRRSWSW